MNDITEPIRAEEALRMYREMMIGSEQHTAPPFVHAVFDDGEGAIVPLGILNLPTADALAIAVSAVKATGKRPLWALAYSDGYLMLGASRDELSDIRRGDLEQRFESGDRNNLSECLTVTMAHRDGRAWTMTQPYARDADQHVVTWEEPHLLEEPGLIGDIIALLRVFVNGESSDLPDGIGILEIALVDPSLN